jgi:peptidoglycan/xylan/chitin deacetylase (PgdA/CDA1 family)
LTTSRALAKEAVGFAVRYGGLTALTRMTVARRKIGILVYHDPSPTLLERHLEYLSRRYSFVTLDDLVRALESGDWRRLPLRGIVLTFDDGHRTNAQLISLFERYSVKPTIYLCSEPIMGSGRFWFREPQVDPEPLKRLPNSERIATIDRLHERSPDEMRGPDERQALDRADVKRMRHVVDFASHSVSHPILPMCSTSESEHEIHQSRRDIARLTEMPCDHFAFPNGDYSPREIELVKQGGYRSARTADLGWNGPGTDRFRLRIIGMPDVASVNVLAAQLAGVLFAKRLVRRLRTGVQLRRSPPASTDQRRRASSTRS